MTHDDVDAACNHKHPIWQRLLKGKHERYGCKCGKDGAK